MRRLAVRGDVARRPPCASCPWPSPIDLRGSDRPRARDVGSPHARARRPPARRSTSPATRSCCSTPGTPPAPGSSPPPASRPLATTSSGLARALGRDDGQDAPVDEVLAAVAPGRRRRARRPGDGRPRGGLRPRPADLAERLLATGAVGCNLEDTDHAAGGRTLRDAGAAGRLPGRRARGRAPDLVLNARVDVHLRAVGEPAARLDAALDRARRYADAGADCVYPIALGDEAALEAFVARAGVPVNALWTRDAPASRAPGRARGRAGQRRRRALRGRPAAGRGARRAAPRRRPDRPRGRLMASPFRPRGAARPARHAVRRARRRRPRRARGAGRVGARARARRGSSRSRRPGSRRRSTRTSATRSSRPARACAPTAARCCSSAPDERHAHDDRAARGARRRARRRGRRSRSSRTTCGPPRRRSSPTSRPWRRARRCRSSSTTSRTGPGAGSAPTRCSSSPASTAWPA